MAEKPIDGLTYEYLQDRKIIFITIENIHREVIDMMTRTLRNHLDYCHDNKQLFLCLADVSQQSVTLTPYARAELIKLAQHQPEVGGKSAFIVRDSIMTRIVQGLFRFLLNQKVRQRRVFINREEALAWLQEAL